MEMIKSLSKYHSVLTALIFSATNLSFAVEPIGTITQLGGSILAKDAHGHVRFLAESSAVNSGDTLVTEADTYARIVFTDKSAVTLSPKSTLIILNYQFELGQPNKNSEQLELKRGGLEFKAGEIAKQNPDHFELKTSIGKIAGTAATFVVEYTYTRTMGSAVLPNYTQIALNTDTTTVSDISPDFGVLQSKQIYLAQNAPGTGGGLAPGLYVHVIDGLIQLSNRGGVQQFAAGQFGFTGSVVQPPVIVPNNPGIQFNPPPAFSSSAAPQSSSTGSKPKTVECEVR